MNLLFVLVFVGLAAIQAPGTIAQSLSQEIAGRYRENRSFYTSVTLGTNGTYTNFLYACSRASSTRVGSAVLTNALLTLKASGSRSDETLYVIAWGGRRYLINTNDMLEFCRAVNGKSEPRDSARGSFLLRENDWSVKVTGKPEVPEPWGKHLVERPAVLPRSVSVPLKQNGRITEVIDGQRAWIDLGREHGLDVGGEVRGLGFAGQYVVEQIFARQSQVRLKGNGRAPRVRAKVEFARPP